jgi:hypothetical protein
MFDNPVSLLPSLQLPLDYSAKIVERVEDKVENTLNLVGSTVEQNINMRKVLKDKIFETAITLQQLFVKITFSGDRNLSEIKI